MALTLTQFEIKTDKSLGHSTLPPSRHRDDPNFHYRNIGQEKLWVCDELYDNLVQTLGECLKPVSEKPSNSNNTNHHDNNKRIGSLELNNEEVEIICEALSPCYKKGHRNALILALSGLLRKTGTTFESALNVVQTLAKDDEEKRTRVATLEEAYKKDPRDVCGAKYFLKTIEGLVPNARDILHKISIIIGKGNRIQRLTRDIMKEYVFKTKKDNEDIYYYDSENGLYVSGGEPLIKELCELLDPEVTTHELQEIINHVKRRSYEDRSKFDTEIDLVNFRNCIVNIHTGEQCEHSPDRLFLT